MLLRTTAGLPGRFAPGCPLGAASEQPPGASLARPSVWDGPPPRTLHLHRNRSVSSSVSVLLQHIRLPDALHQVHMRQCNACGNRSSIVELVRAERLVEPACTLFRESSKVAPGSAATSGSGCGAGADSGCASASAMSTSRSDAAKHTLRFCSYLSFEEVISPMLAD